MRFWHGRFWQTAIIAVAALTASPVSAQYLNCPAGYVFATGVGCVPATGAYNSFYGGPRYYGAAPIYEPYGFAYGGLRGRFGGYHGPVGFRGGFGGHREGGFRGGGFHGGGRR